LPKTVARALKIASWWMVSSLCTGPAGAQPASPVQALEELADVELFLELVVNGRQTGRIVPVTFRDGRSYVNVGELQAINIPIDRAPGDVVSLANIPGVRAEYDSHAQQLKLTVPAAWLPGQVVGTGYRRERVPLLANAGGLINYDLFATGTGGIDHLALSTGGRVFGRWGSLSTNGVVRRGLNEPSTSRKLRYLRYDTTWTFSDDRSLVTYTAGDLITGALPWTNPVRLSGVSVARNFQVRPDIITYPLPTFAGQSAVPTTVDLFVNGSHMTSATVQPGPFVIHDVPLISGAGTATIVTTDPNGRRVSRDFSFYVANTLLRKGMVDFSASAGVTRRSFGLSSFAYGKPAGALAVRYGLTDVLTIAGHIEGGRELAAGSFGADLRVGIFGVLSGATALGDGFDAAAHQYSLDYSYTGRHFNITLRHLSRGAGFRDLSSYDQPTGPSALPRHINQITGALLLGRRGGTVGVGYFGIESADGGRTEVANLSYTRGFVFGTSLFGSINRTMDRNRQTVAQVQLVIPLGDRRVVSTSLSRSDERGLAPAAQYSRSLPSSTGVGWSAMTSDGDRHGAEVTWRMRTAQVQTGASREMDRTALWGSLSGSLVVMGGSLHTANRVSDSFLLVDTDGYAGVPVLQDHKVVGRTNRHGRLLVPSVSAHYGTTYEIDPLDLPPGVHVPFVEQRVAVHRRSGAVLRFPIEAVRAASITIVDAAGEPVDVGTHVTHVESGERTVVGWDGFVYLQNVGEQNTLVLQVSEEETCRVQFTADVRGSGIAKVGPLVCK
jgi:outer membrane usher protein